MSVNQSPKHNPYVNHQSTAHALAQHGHASHHEQHGSAQTYVVGYFLSLLMTLIPFGLVAFEAGHTLTIVALILTMFAQVWIQLVMFMHMKRRDPNQRYNILSFWYTFITIAILFIGSVWIMYHLHINMM